MTTNTDFNELNIYIYTLHIILHLVRQKPTKRFSDNQHWFQWIKYIYIYTLHIILHLVRQKPTKRFSDNQHWFQWIKYIYIYTLHIILHLVRQNPQRDLVTTNTDFNELNIYIYTLHIILHLVRQKPTKRFSDNQHWFQWIKYIYIYSSYYIALGSTKTHKEI